MASKIHELDAQMLAGAVLGLSEEQTEAIMGHDEDFDTPLLDKFGIDFDQFYALADAMIEFAPTVHSPLTNTVYHAFVRQLGSGNFMAIAKVKAKEQPNETSSKTE